MYSVMYSVMREGIYLPCMDTLQLLDLHYSQSKCATGM